ncbi:MAG: hypothetical protein ACREMD_00885 [Gemmatimonadota bacterium]
MTEGGNDMEEARRIEQDLGYVREVVDRSERSGSPRAIWYMWAAIGAVGFALIDFRPPWVPVFWAIAGPLGFVVSAWLGRRHARTTGQESRREGYVHMLHWGGMGGAIILLVFFAARGHLTGVELAQAILLVVALGYFLAGVHLARPLVWVGLLLAGSFLAVEFIDGYVWTAVGVVMALALVVTAHMGGEVRGAAARP